MKLTITYKHDSALPVKKYGGTERIVFWLMKEMVKQGHKVYFIGEPSSDVEQYGINLIAHDNKNVPSTKWNELIPEDTDIVHTHANEEHLHHKAAINTVHGNGKPGELFHQNSVFVSKKHAENHQSQAFVYNAIDFDEYPLELSKINGKSNHCSFLAKASWRVKNLKDSLDICKQTKSFLHIMGGKTFLPRSYAKSYGPVDQKTKVKILSQSSALLFPVLWHEPFGIAVIEAMAFNLNIFSSSFGSLKELIPKGHGYTFDHKKDLIEMMKSISIEKNFQNREYAQDNFSTQIMANAYLKYYQKVLNKEVLNEKQPTWNLQKPANELLTHFRQ